MENSMFELFDYVFGDTIDDAIDHPISLLITAVLTIVGGYLFLRNF